jgi:5'-nucleotidase
MKKHLFVAVILFSSYSYAKSIPITIYHTNDLHSHFEGVKVQDQQTGYKIRGGFDRLITAINNIREEKKNEIVIGVDAGDFFAGTVFSAIAPSSDISFPEYEFLSAAKFDVVTLGNHEFDTRNNGLDIMLSKAQSLNSETKLLASNLYLKNSNSTLKKFIGNDALIKEAVIKQFSYGLDVVKIAFLGILGPDACLASKATRGDVGFFGFNDDKSKMEIKNLIKFINLKALELKNKQQADLVIISMHGGSEEAEEIVKDLKNVDLIIAGHTHQVERKIIDGKILSQTGDYGQNLGVLELFYDTSTKKLSFVNESKSSIVRIDEKLKSDNLWKSKINILKKKSFSLLGLDYNEADKEIFIADRDYERKSETQNELGVMLTSRLLNELNDQKLNIDFYFTSMGLVRDSIKKGVAYTAADVFELMGIGFDDQLVPGVNTVSFYLTTDEVRKVINFLELYSYVSKNFAPVFSDSVSFEINKYGIPFVNRIKNLKINGVELDDTNRLIKIATNKFVIDNLSTIDTATYGLIKIDPKNEKGESIRQYPKHQKEFELLIRSFEKKP